MAQRKKTQSRKTESRQTERVGPKLPPTTARARIRELQNDLKNRARQSSG